MRRKVIISLTFVIEIVLIVLSFLFINKIIKINPLFAKMYPVWGVDVSSHQGKIDWRVLKKQGVQFAFIKATEGSSFVDKNFIF